MRVFPDVFSVGFTSAMEAELEHQKDWFDDTMLYLADRYEDLSEEELAELRVLGERFSRPVQRKVEAATTGAA